MPRTTHPSAGSMTTRAPSSSTPTTSCPGTKGYDVRGSRYSDMWPPIAARSEPQMPLTLGITRTQSRAGRTGSGTSPSFSIDSALVATSGRPPAAFTTAKAGTDRTYWRASTASPSGPAGHLPMNGEESSSTHRFEVLRRARVRHRQPPVARRHAPPLDPPAALRGHLRQARVGIDHHRSSHHLEHGQVGQRVRIREALAERDAAARSEERRVGKSVDLGCRGMSQREEATSSEPL